MKGGNQYRQNFFDDFMFGKKRVHHKDSDRHDLKGQIQTIEHFLNKIDLDELMENIDNVVDTAKQLKPYVNKISPYLQQFLKK